MDRAGATSRASKRRHILADGSSKANIPQHTSVDESKSNASDASSIPHHESIAANGALTIRNVAAHSHAQGHPPEHKRLSAVPNEDESKRDSQVSSTSTSASAKGRKRKTHIGPWLLGSDVGKGGTGKVRKVRHVVTGQDAAAKIISKKVAERARAESLISLVESAKKNRDALPAGSVLMPFGVEREVVIMKLLNHPNIVKLYDIWENRNELYLVMEYIEGGELFDYIDGVGHLEPDETVWVFRQVLAALLHCHRLGIHHRDLKPENILLDNSDVPRVKLVDFGMAALQPQGKLLTTPCGSIHYAAPEVFEKCYDGSKVDVWSLGIILFVMLTGTTPFAYDSETMKDDVSKWYRLIKSGKFRVPDTVPVEAEDLLRRMIVPDPRKRITLEGCWKHPFVQKFSKEWGASEEEMEIEKWIGDRPTIVNWRLKHVDQVDREILWNLRMLWHSVKEEALLKRLLSKEANQEKFFYTALESFRDEQLENWGGTLEGMGYSASDYHHLRPVHRSELPPIPPSAYSRTKSQFSILDDHDRQSRASSRSRSKGRDQPASERSYDPYRASREPTIKDTGYNVNVHRGRSDHGSKKSGSTLREELLRKQRHTSIASSKSSLYRVRNPARPSTRSSASRGSLVSSNFASSPPVITTASASRKRPVQFSHHRKSSRASTHASLPTPTTTETSKTSAAKTSPSLAQNRSTVPSQVKSRKEAAATLAQPKHLRADGRLVDHDTRKLSTELEQYMDGVFYRSGHSSSSRTATTTPTKVANDTPFTSFSQDQDQDQGPESSERPLPDLPLNPETPNTYLVKELAETKKKLIDRFAHDQNGNAANYQQVLAQLDQLLQAPLFDRRAVSAPEATTQLPAIPEIESSRQLHSDEPDYSDRPAIAGKKPSAATKGKATIRPVQPSSPVIAPLNIRKASGSAINPATPKELHTASAVPGRFYYDGMAPIPNENVLHDRQASAASPASLATISEEATNSSKDLDKGTSKVRQWFARKKAGDQEKEKEKRGPRSWEDLDDRVHKSIAATTSGARNVSGSTDRSSPSQQSRPKPGFFAFLRKKRQNREQGRMAIGGKRFPSSRSIYSAERFLDTDDDDESLESTVALSVTPSHAGRTRRTSRELRHGMPALGDQQLLEAKDLGVQQGFFARMFNIKPATHVMCFQRGRGYIRSHLVRTLRELRVHGIRDVVLDRSRNLIWGSLTANNCTRRTPLNQDGLEADKDADMNVKAVAFVVELLVVLEHGRRAGLCLARFTQRKGAASSFRKMTLNLEDLLMGRGLIVENAQRRRDMQAILDW